MTYHYINLINVSKRNTVLLFLFALVWETSFGWRWKTEDAIIQDVWPENGPASSIKLKRASARSIDIPRMNSFTIEKPELASSKSSEDVEDDLVFEGQYFKPNEVPLPPPPFMVMNSNWRGAVGINQIPDQNKQQTLYKQQTPSSYFVVGVGNAPPPSEKFTADNVKIPDENATRTEEKIHSSSNASPKTVSFPQNQALELPSFEDIHYFEEKDLELLEIFKDARKCYTPTDTEGRCITFKKCFPVVFNVIDGELRNPGLAKLLYQASGPCNATLEFEFAFRKLNDEKAYLNPDFYNQSICCPGFKHPPESIFESSPNERSARLIVKSTEKEKISSSFSETSTISTSRTSANPSITASSSVTFKPKADEDILKLDEFHLTSSSRKPPVEVNENSEELETVEINIDNKSTPKSPSLVFDDIEDNDDEFAGGEDMGEIVMESPSLNDNASQKDGEADSFGKEERRGDRDKSKDGDGDEEEEEYYKKGVKVVDAFSAVPAPNLSPMTCRQLIYGMPRGHWPWMVALVISSRHICSGALIDEKHVVTAAHCVYLLSEADVRKLRIIIGDRVMYSSVDGPHFWRKVTKVITHVNYNQQTFASDIAILKLNSAVPFSRNIQPISLPDSTSVDSSLIYGKGIVAGWSGADIGQPAFEARTEIETVVDIMDKVECHEIYRGFALSGLSANTFCTKPVNNTCVADSGAPLIVRSQNCWILQGIMSWGIGCSHFPEVYTDVSRFTPWIRKHLN